MQDTLRLFFCTLQVAHYQVQCENYKLACDDHEDRRLGICLHREVSCVNTSADFILQFNTNSSFHVLCVSVSGYSGGNKVIQQQFYKCHKLLFRVVPGVNFSECSSVLMQTLKNTHYEKNPAHKYIRYALPQEASSEHAVFFYTPGDKPTSPSAMREIQFRL